MIYWVRHWIVEEPYNDYDKCSFEENIDLHTWKKDPWIDKEKTIWILRKNISQNILFKVDNIYTSTQKRCLETSEMINEILGGWIKIIPVENLVEVKYNPSKYLSEQDFLKHWWMYLRNKVLWEIYDGKIESINMIYNRINTFINSINYDENSIIVSHALLLKFIDIFLNKWKTNADINLDYIINHSLNINKWSFLKINAK